MVLRIGIVRNVGSEAKASRFSVLFLVVMVVVVVVRRVAMRNNSLRIH